MTTHHLIFRMGVADRTKIAALTGAKRTEVDLVASERRLGFGLGNALDFLASKGLRPSEMAIDLLIVAAAVTAADTRVVRKAHAQDKWTRELALNIPVLDPVLWTGQSELLERTLRFLTGDFWAVQFRQRPGGFASLAMPAEVIAIEPSCVCLFSGGLDSFIGATDLLERGETPLFVSHYGDYSTSAQPLCLNRLAKQYPNIPQFSLRSNISFPADLVEEEGSETTLRGRSFLFFSLAALAASTFEGAVTIVVPENGLISLNVPLDPLRLGALSTRTTHPFYMARFNKLLANLGIAATLDNPYRFQTKGAMVAKCANRSFLSRYAKETMSCSHPTEARHRGESPAHCGRCVPCLIRRAAMNAGLGNDDTNYHMKNLRASTLDSKAAAGADIRSFQLAIAKLKQRPALARVLVRQPGPLSDYSDAEVAQYAQVYADGLAEVGKTLTGVVVEPR